MTHHCPVTIGGYTCTLQCGHDDGLSGIEPERWHVDETHRGTWLARRSAPSHAHPYNVVYDNDREYDGRLPQHLADVAAVIAGHTQTQTKFTRPTSTLAGSLRHRIALARLAKREAS
jgi:hypothetical protein